MKPCGHTEYIETCNLCRFAVLDERYAKAWGEPWPPPKADRLKAEPTRRHGVGIPKTELQKRSSKPRMSFSGMAEKKSRCQEAKERGEKCTEFSQTEPAPSPYAFSGQPVGRRHLVYHVYPIKDSAWKNRVRDIVRYWNRFDGCKFVAVATDDKSDSADEVRAMLPADVVVREFVNHPKTWERATWDWLWASALAVAEDHDAVFRAHAKAVTRPAGSVFHEWADVALTVSLECWPEIEDQLRRHPITGPFLRRNPNGMFGFPDCRFHYSGTFFWVRVGTWRGRDWRSAPQHSHGVEAWPGMAFRPDEAGCLLMEAPNINSTLDKESFWESTVRPAYAKWKEKVRPVGPTLHVITPTIRHENLPRIAESLGMLRGLNLRWHVLTSPGIGYGGEERTEGIDCAKPDDWLWFCDDDNLPHPEFGDALARAIKDHPAASGFIFAQEFPGGRRRLPARIPRATGEIDTAQFVFRRSAIGDIRWPGFRCADARFATAVCDRNPGGRIVCIDRAVTIYNALRSGEDRMTYLHPHSVPGWFLESEGRLWGLQCCGRRVLELGRFQGRSTICAAQRAHHVVSIDRNSDYDARTHIEAWGLSHKVTLLTGEIADLVPKLDGKFGAVLHDATHTREEIEADMALVMPLLEPDAILGFHDFGNPSYPDVKPTVDDLAERHGWATVGIAGSLAVFRVCQLSPCHFDSPVPSGPPG